MRDIVWIATLLTVAFLAAVVVFAGCGKSPSATPSQAPVQPAQPSANQPAGQGAEHGMPPAAAESPSSQASGGAAAKAQTLCPVMGNPIDKSIFADYDGKRIYFCCPACPPVFKKDPEKYMSKLKAEGIQLESSPQP